MGRDGRTDSCRHRATAWSSVGSRLAGVIFFVGFRSREYHMFGYFDGLFLVPELILLTLALRAESSPKGVRYGQRAAV